MTPLIVITGFLGAGKTTLLRQLVPRLIEGGLVPSVILNDYQNARVDAELFRDMKAVVTPISGSCVCCGSREELRSALLAVGHEAGVIALVEANGTTDAEELVANLASDPELRNFSAPVQVGLVDAKRWQKRFWHNGLERDQLRPANHLILGHADEVSPARLEEIAAAVASLNHSLHPTTPEILARHLIELTHSLTSLTREEARAHSGHTCEKEGDHGHHHHEPERHHFAAMELALPDNLTEEVLLKFLRGLPREVLRAKGLARLSPGTNQPARWAIFQKVEASDSPQVAFLGGEPTDPRPVLILVGPHLPDPQELLAGLGNLR